MRFRTHFSGLGGRASGWFQSCSSREDLHSDSDFSCIRDVRLPTRDQMASCHYAGHSELMPQRLEQAGLDAAYIKSFYTSTYQDMQRVCASCKAWRLCARHLAEGDVQAGMKNYCLNAPTIDALLIERPPWLPS